MRRITWSAVLLLSVLALGAGCSKQGGPKSATPVPLPRNGPASFEGPRPTPPIPPPLPARQPAPGPGGVTR
jgi:hypothetical protein